LIFETDAVMEISIYMLVSEISSFSCFQKGCIKHSRICVSLLETPRHQQVQVQPLALTFWYNQ